MTTIYLECRWLLLGIRHGFRCLVCIDCHKAQWTIVNVNRRSMHYSMCQRHDSKLWAESEQHVDLECAAEKRK